MTLQIHLYNSPFQISICWIIIQRILIVSQCYRTYDFIWFYNYILPIHPNILIEEAVSKEPIILIYPALANTSILQNPFLYPLSYFIVTYVPWFPAHWRFSCSPPPLLGDTWSDTLAYAAIWGGAGLLTAAVIMFYGTDFVDAPKLVHKEKMDWVSERVNVWVCGQKEKIISWSSFSGYSSLPVCFRLHRLLL